MAAGPPGSGQVYIAIIKLVELLSRAGFTVAVAFMLPLDAAGRFGIIVTLVSLFAFAFGWERHVDLQRRLVGGPEHRFDEGVAAALRLYGFNWLAMLPLFWLAMAFWTGPDPLLLALATIVVLSEQLANQLYNITLVQPRYQAALTTVAVKNVGVALAIAAFILFAPSRLSVELVVTIWAIASALGTAALAFALVRVRAPLPPEAAREAPGIFDQHRASLTHFLIGLVAVLSLQIDRLVAGGLLPLAEVGIYFRHILLVSFAYQLFNITSYNRVVPKVFAAARTEPVATLFAILRRELIMLAAVIIGGLAAALAIDAATGHYFTGRFALQPALGAILLSGALVRIAGDQQSMILNATMRERLILRHQLIALAAGATALAALTLAFGLYGTACATIVPASLYLALNLTANLRGPGRHLPAAARPS
jgi:O-antigen/teichoic acid export membrane protein